MTRREFLKNIFYFLTILVLPFNIPLSESKKRNIKIIKKEKLNPENYNPYFKTETPIYPEYPLNNPEKNLLKKIHFQTDEKLREYMVLIDKNKSSIL